MIVVNAPWSSNAKSSATEKVTGVTEVLPLAGGVTVVEERMFTVRSWEDINTDRCLSA